MLPLQQAIEVRKSILEYVKATYVFNDLKVREKFYQFIEDDRHGLLKGPFISLKTPFVSADPSETIPLDIAPSFSPHWHQLEAFKRLTTKNGNKPVPTLLTTGTGSGKTECFLYPILDYCYQCNKIAHQPGVKVIIMYPMNALATDQAKRIAEAIDSDARLKDKVTAGLFIGEGENAKEYPDTMGPDHIIEKRSAITAAVPDILLTNFKMLDYGLMQQRFMPLWKGNIDSDNPALRFIVLDELHTYDGAQGTDVANLIRRLKLKLNLKQGDLCPIGTSATIGNGVDSKRELCRYAESVFGEHFDAENVIEEHRIPVDDFFSVDRSIHLPSEYELADCEFQPDDTADTYLKRLHRIWLPAVPNSSVEIGKALRKHPVVRDLLKVTSLGVLSLPELVNELARINREISPLCRSNEKYGVIIVESILALISQAKIPGEIEGKDLPLLQLQVQLWVRELSGILRYVQKDPEFTWRGKLSMNRVALSMYYCRECGASGWLSRRGRTDSGFGMDVKANNRTFMSHKPEAMLLNTVQHRPIDEYMANNANNCFTGFVNSRTLRDVLKDDRQAIELQVCTRHYSRDGREYFDRMCPECGSTSLSIVGTRTATLSSVAMSQVFSSDFEEADVRDRKIITFTNSVQDAAFQAGFYEARTYNFLFRQSLQQYLNSVGKPMTLTDVQKGFKEFWKNRLQGDEYYYRFLATDLIGKVDLDRNYRENGLFTQAFKDEFDLRVDWNICVEFGLNAQLGRTLEKTGASATFFKKDDLVNLWDEIKEWCKNENFNIQEDEFLKFVNGILHRMRLRGAVDHPYLDWCRSADMKRFQLNWGMKDKQFGRSQEHFLNRVFGGSLRRPRMLSTLERPAAAAVSDLRETLDWTFAANTDTWYTKYFYKSFQKCFSLAGPAPRGMANDFYKELFRVMEKDGLVNVKEACGGNYAINPSVIWIEPKVRQIGCSVCNMDLCVAGSDDVSLGTPCLSHGCNGVFNNDDAPIENYYQMVYNRRETPRIYAREHTGILERAYREWLEKDFKKRPRFNSINALSATSTLEMGIDIGDLNVVANADIPPKPSNFLQRVGRAGRKSGSALVLNYAGQDNNHDMFYFDEPLEMMAGDISTPGCFLEAKDIFRRHFLAFCIDSWVASSVDNDLYQEMRFLGLKKSLATDPNFKINVLCRYIEDNAQELKTKFIKQYPESSCAVLTELFDDVDSGVFYNRIRNEFVNQASRLVQIMEARKEIAEDAESIADNDPRKEEYGHQVYALGRQIEKILDENVIEFMTDSGLLPNYAFPEKGIELQANIRQTRAKNDSQQNIGEPKEIEIVRPASTGIRELAPGNTFFSQGFKLPITGVDVSTIQRSGSNTSQNTLKLIRFCSRCDALAEEGSEEYGNAVCPKCGSGSWGSNIHKFLNFVGAVSRTTTVDAVLNDSSENRVPVPYISKLHFRFKGGTVRSYEIENSGFGIEFCKSVMLDSVNYGMRDHFQTMQTVAGDGHVPEYGFITCKCCGKSTSKLFVSDDDKKWHYAFCRYRDVDFNPIEIREDVFTTFYLHRSFETEAIKVLLPVQNFESDVMIQLFKAGLSLGLRYFYQSSPDHIRIADYKEFNTATSEFDNYLVLYDTIPGGTGYLAKLFSPESFSKLLEIAYDKIHNCKCAEDGRDGCYHCILSYENKYYHSSLSRAVADTLFAKLCVPPEAWKEYDASLGTIAKNGVAEDSELELKFISELEKVAQEKQWHFEKKSDVDSYHYELFIVDGENEFKYIIWPQYTLKYTIPDFQFICVYAKIDGQEQKEESLPQWSVFMDGYAYHASKNCFRFYGDVKKRDSIRNDSTTCIFPWTIVYDDMFNKDGSDSVIVDRLSAESDYNQRDEFPNRIKDCHNSFERFIRLLTFHSVDDIRQEVGNYLACWFTDLQENKICRIGDVNAAVMKNVTDEYSDRVTDEDKENGEFYVRTSLIPDSLLASGSAWFHCEDTMNKASFVYSFKLNENLGDIELDQWKDYWQVYNLLQFFTEISGNTGLQKGSSNIEKILENYEPCLEHVIRELVAAGIWVNPDGETAILSEDGISVVAEADLVVQKQKIVVNLWDEKLEDTIIKMGYKVFTTDNFNMDEVK